MAMRRGGAAAATWKIRETGARLRYRVRETSTRRSFATRSVDGVQRGELVFKMQASFAADARGPTDPEPPEHQADAPEGVPPPEDLPSFRDTVEGLMQRLPPSGRFREELMRLCAAPVDLRLIDPIDPLDPDPPRSAR